MENKVKTYLAISVLEAIYVIYMLRYFKTRYSLEFNRSLDYMYIIGNQIGISKKQLYHTTSNSNTPISHICLFGNNISLLIGFYLIIRCFIPSLRKNNKYFIFLIFIGSLMNFNALVYLVPFFFVEYYLSLTYHNLK